LPARILARCARLDGVHIRPSRPDDAAAVDDVVARAFGEEEEGPTIVRLLGLLVDGGHRVAGLVADDGGTVLGHVQLSRSWVDARERLVDVLVLSPLSVHPDAQGRGIGTALVAAALDHASALRVPAVFLEGAPAYYGARGFVGASAHGFVRPSVRIPDAAFQVALLDAHEPWMTGALVYCDPFWVTDAVGLRDPLLAQIQDDPVC
jgi:putative acetyltransferase